MPTTVDNTLAVDTTDITPEDVFSSDVQVNDSRDLLEEFMTKLSSELSDLRSTLESHITKSSAEIRDIKDVVYSLKKHSHMCSRQVSDNSKSVHDATNTVQNKVDHLHEDLLRKWQSTTDSIKSQISHLLSNNKYNVSSQINMSLNMINASSNELRESKNHQRELQEVEPLSPPTPVTEPEIESTVIKEQLILGDSLLKGINKRGLRPGVHIKTLRGATTENILDYLNTVDLYQFDKVIFHVGVTCKEYVKIVVN
ncbi:hypothetical protein ACF0H5_013236 [Mactra antiquata]